MAANYQLHKPRDITPLQVWNMPLSESDPQPLWSALSTERFANLRPSRRHYVLADTLARAKSSIVRAAFDRGLLEPSRSPPHYLCAQAWIYGGLAQTVGLRDVLNLRSDSIFFVSRAPQDYLWLLRKCWHPKKPVLTCDVGQTSVKMRLVDGTRVNLQRKKYAPKGDADLATHFIGCALKQLVATAPPGTPLMLAFPWPLESDLVPGESTYGVGGRKTFMQEISDIAKFKAGTQVTVANDAVFAAECARVEKTLLGNTLVMTLGHGPGAALLHE